jgi:hypothetical protein
LADTIAYDALYCEQLAKNENLCLAIFYVC